MASLRIACASSANTIAKAARPHCLNIVGAQPSSSARPRPLSSVPRSFKKFFGGAPSPGNAGGKEYKGKYGDLIRRASFAMAGTQLAPTSAPEGQDIATFAGGCFWGLELAFQRMPGVTHTSVGYTGGKTKNPSYREVCSGSTGHAEAVQVYFKPAEVTYEQLLDNFFDKVDPTTKDRQGNDMGTQYRSAIYYHNEQQKAAAQKAIEEVNKKLNSSLFRRVIGSKVVTTVEPFDGEYWMAEDYHQQYLEKGGQNAAKGAWMEEARSLYHPADFRIPAWRQ